MNRLRALRFRSYVMPLLLAALVFRVLVPPGFMMGGAGSTSLQVAMCTTTPGKSETIELPGRAAPHCEYCVAPPLGAPFAAGRIDPPLRAFSPPFKSVVAQLAGATILRAQSARAPPSA
ncbi:MAG: hypothetical protein WDO72_02690 [Pseudomonadota bacterium]